jgi:hypothetical protein
LGRLNGSERGRDRILDAAFEPDVDHEVACSLELAAKLASSLREIAIVENDW